LKVLVTGSTGLLGSTLVNQLTNLNYEVKLTSRRKPDITGSRDFKWVYSDMLTGEGIEESVKDVDVIIHAATSPTKNSKLIEVSEFERFISKIQHVKHFIYPSIVGIDEIPMKYYQFKCEAEEILKNSSIPYTIARATQFHSFVDQLLLSRPLFKRYLIPGDMKFQSVDVEDFGHHLIQLMSDGPKGRVDDFGGPEIMTLREMAELKMKINNETKKVFSFSLPGKLYKSFLEGKNTNPIQKRGKITFEEFLRNKLDRGPFMD
jgi:uncharacterized protein YbjT (DUF2867 family)